MARMVMTIIIIISIIVITIISSTSVHSHDAAVVLCSQAAKDNLRPNHMTEVTEGSSGILEKKGRKTSAATFPTHAFWHSHLAELKSTLAWQHIV